ncbi:MAG: glycosyltransferase [Proteobacteria bacterium]|nr:glycosyltransferase [Pseudomonadota bacterium]
MHDAVPLPLTAPDSPDSAPTDGDPERLGGAWLDALKLDEFVLLNGDWLGPVRNKTEAARAMLSSGVQRLAPLAFDLEFDPEYYREVHPEYADLDDPETYRRWLFQDLERNWPPSPAKHLRHDGLELEEFPAGFDWRSYLEQHPEAGPNRWSALVHLLYGGFQEHGPPPVHPEGGAAFLAALGKRFRARDDGLAVRAFQSALSMGDAPPDTAHELGDAFYRLSSWAEALASFEAAVRTHQASLWTFVNGVRSANRIGAFQRAFALLRQGKDQVAGHPLWRTVLQETIEGRFLAAEIEARALYAREQRAAADAVLSNAVLEALQKWETFDPLGIPLPAARNGRIVLLVNTDLRQCTHYRVEQKEQLLRELGRDFAVFDARTEVEAFISALPGASAAIFYRLPAFPAVARAIQLARGLGVPTFYDIDDLIFEARHYPEPFETYGGAITPEFYQGLQFGVPLFRAAMALCDHGIASTPSLAEHMKPVVRSGTVFVLPNGLDDRNQGMLHEPPARVRRDGNVVVFYGSGTKAHNSDFLELAGPARLAILQRNFHVRLVVVGHLTLDARFDTVRDQIVSLDWTSSIADYWSLLTEADINLAVLAPYPTTDAKSEIKWLEAAVMGLPSIVSDTARYREVVEDGVDALTASTPEGWRDALTRLVEDPSLRRRIGERARLKAAERYTLEANAQALQVILQAADDSPRPSPESRPDKRRILLLNIFFPPQTIGGSTRVVRDNLDAFLRSEQAAQYEFAVVTSDNANPTPNQVRVEDYRGVPVFRLSTPEGINMEWRPFDPEVEATFKNILETWRPDLVHFHCVQRMSASVVLAAREAGVPYINTLHDAWWVSDYQFLVDEAGRVREPCEALPLDPPPPVTVGEALERRRRLRPLLEGSAEILGVSRSFTRLYQDCGFPRARPLPNGVPPMPPVMRRPSASGRVRLTHVGSKTRHKGYFLVQAALKQGRFENLELTVIDHSRYGGPEEHTVWGATPVRFVGKTRQERMQEFYAGQDVLLAPSIWPESFGLVSREALAAGLWVVASDVGAIGEDVTPGVNGWIIDVRDTQALRRVLSEINANPQTYREPPPATVLRTSDEQAQDLLEVYRGLLAR